MTLRSLQWCGAASLILSRPGSFTSRLLQVSLKERLCSLYQQIRERGTGAWLWPLLDPLTEEASESLTGLGSSTTEDREREGEGQTAKERETEPEREQRMSERNKREDRKTETERRTDGKHKDREGKKGIRGRTE